MNNENILIQIGGKIGAKIFFKDFKIFCLKILSLMIKFQTIDNSKYKE